MQLSNSSKIILALIVFNHLVGWIGLSFTPYVDLMLALTPVNLLLTSALVVSQGEFKKLGFIYAALFTMAFGWIMEVLGVHTGVIFGEYSYSSVLGPKLLDVPIMIAINWFLLAYVIFSFTLGLRKVNDWKGVPLNALLMVLADVLIEPYAVEFGLWEWASASGMPGILNYLAWFLISIIVFAVYKLLLSDKPNYLAGLTFPVLLMFFLLNILF